MQSTIYDLCRYSTLLLGTLKIFFCFVFLYRNCLKSFVKTYLSNGLSINIKNLLTIQWTVSRMLRTV